MTTVILLVGVALVLIGVWGFVSPLSGLRPGLIKCPHCKKRPIDIDMYSAGAIVRCTCENSPVIRGDSLAEARRLWNGKHKRAKR